jgi:O-antigen/teichoic acid export membrane protein
MTVSSKVAKNSVWLVIQPLALNLISLFAIGYIIRVLGKVDYGKFVFAFSLVAMFAPLSNMGLRAITVREVARDREQAREFTRKMLTARTLLSLVTMVLLAASVNALGYDRTTVLVVYWAATTLLTQAISSTLQDVFQAHENMAYVAYSSFIGGFTLTLLSVPVLFFGMGVVGLTVVYALGNLITAAIAWRYASKLVGWPRPELDWDFIKRNLLQAAPFFYPTIILVAGSKASTFVLSQWGGDAAVGSFGAANTLVDKLTIISDGICTAMYPSLVILYKESVEEAGDLFRRFFEFLVLIGLPIAVGATLLAEPLIALICGPDFASAAPVLRILSWALLASYLGSILGWTLGAIHLEKKAAIVYLVTGPIFVIANLLLVPLRAEQGAAWANLGASIASFAFLAYFVKTLFVREIIAWDRLVRIVLANALMGVAVYPARHLTLAIPIAIGIASYVAAGLLVGVVAPDQLRRMASVVARRLARR